jgi:DNA-binding PadR family transcriptional regulator
MLLLLAEREYHGYQLYEKIKELGFDGECLDKTILYRDLRELEELDLITSRWDSEESKGPRRRVYKINDNGLTNLDEWMEVLVGLTERINDVRQRYSSYKEQNR